MQFKEGDIVEYFHKNTRTSSGKFLYIFKSDVSGTYGEAINFNSGCDIKDGHFDYLPKYTKTYWGFKGFETDIRLLENFPQELLPMLRSDLDSANMALDIWEKQHKNQTKNKIT